MRTSLKACRASVADLNNEIGLSDHCEDNYAAAVAAYHGVHLFEKHITLDRTLPGPDHAFSLEPAGLFDLVCAVRAGHAMKAGEAHAVRADQAKRSPDAFVWSSSTRIRTSAPSRRMET